VRNAGAAHVAREQWTVKFPPAVVPGFAPYLDRVAKIVGVSDDYDAVARCEDGVRRDFGGHVSAARSQPYYLDVTHPDANKGHVVDVVSQTLSISAAQIATIGDMPNDVLMFQRSGLSIAMGNATPEVQAQARFVTSSNEDEGFAKAMDAFVLGELREPAADAPRAR
jgi:hydroxymethylpyrimidine pyrophosphatase-like HAD family hydrolase